MIFPVSEVSQDQEEITLESPEIVNRARVDSLSLVIVDVRENNPMEKRRQKWKKPEAKISSGN